MHQTLEHPSNVGHIPNSFDNAAKTRAQRASALRERAAKLAAEPALAPLLTAVKRRASELELESRLFDNLSVTAGPAELVAAA